MGISSPKGVIEYLSNEDAIMLKLAGEMDIDERTHVEINENGFVLTKGHAIFHVHFDELIFQPPRRKEILYGIVNINDVYYLNIYGKTDRKYYLAKIEYPCEKTMEKYMVRLGRLRNSLF